MHASGQAQTCHTIKRPANAAAHIVNSTSTKFEKSLADPSVCEYYTYIQTYLSIYMFIYIYIIPATNPPPPHSHLADPTTQSQKCA